MQIKYVVSTMVFWWREHHLSFEQECEFLRSLGYGIELWPTMKGHNDCRYEKRNWPRLNEATHDMLVSLNSRTDGPTIREWDEQIQCAAMLKACIVANLRSLCISDELGIADWDFAAEVVKAAQQNNVMLCIENGSLDAMLEVGNKFDYIKYCLDTGSANLDPKHSFTDYVDKLAQRTTYVHFSDNYGRFDDHAAPGLRGGIPRKDWDYLLAGLDKYDNDIIGSLEMSPCMPGAMIRQGSEYLFNTLGWPDQPAPLPGHDETFYRPT